MSATTLPHLRSYERERVAPPTPATATVSPRTLEWILRLATAGCFIGHGAFGIITKAGWLPYFAVAAIPEPTAWTLMPWVGTMDITMGLLALVLPLRLNVWWCVAWALWTAALRPLSGEGIWEFCERAGNYGAPLALLALAGWRGSAFRRLTVAPTALDDPTTRRHLAHVLRLGTALLLLGHAGCHLFDAKPVFLQLTQVLFPAAGATTQLALGGFELALAIAVLLTPSARLLAFVLLWKLATESLWPFAGHAFWEIIERSGSYGLPLAYALLLRRSAS